MWTGGNIMIAELRTESQVTIPKNLVDKLGLLEGDKLEIYEENGVICIMPVVVYPEDYVEKLLDDIEEVRAKAETGEYIEFNSVDDLIADLEDDE